MVEAQSTKTLGPVEMFERGTVNLFTRQALYISLRLHLWYLSHQNRPDDFGNILRTKAFSGKHLKEKC